MRDCAALHDIILLYAGEMCDVAMTTKSRRAVGGGVIHEQTAPRGFGITSIGQSNFPEAANSGTCFLPALAAGRISATKNYAYANLRNWYFTAI
jgi:hypothetical protein